MSYRYFAFLDLLGYRDLIGADLATGSHALRDKLVASFGALGQINEADVSVRAISDSIYLTLNNDALGFKYFASVVRDLQLAFIQNGLLLRGGIAFNEHFENGKVTYSPALIDAYQLESRDAFFPRVLVQEAVIEKLLNEEALAPVVASGLLVTHASKYQVHVLDDQNWAEIFDHVSRIAQSDCTFIEKDPRIFAKHWYLQEYLFHFRPKGARAKRYLPTWK
jgi:hypothetical protein